MSVALLVLQAISGPPAPVVRRPIAVERRCPTGESGDVVVCARPSDGDRLKPLPERYVRSEGLPRAQLRAFGDSTLGLVAEQGRDAQGGPINRALVRLTIPLGGRRR